MKRVSAVLSVLCKVKMEEELFSMLRQDQNLPYVIYVICVIFLIYVIYVIYLIYVIVVIEVI